MSENKDNPSNSMIYAAVLENKGDIGKLKGEMQVIKWSFVVMTLTLIGILIKVLLP